MYLVKNGRKTIVNDVSCNDADHSSSMMDGYFSGGHPLSADWLEGLSGDMRVIAEAARKSLIDNNRNDKELAEALLLMKGWTSKSTLTASRTNIPKVIRQEKLGCQLEPGALIEFLLAHEEINGFRHYEFLTLAILQEIHGLSELEIVAGKNELSSCVQYFTLRISRLHIALLFIRMMNTLPHEQRDIFEEVAAYLFQDTKLQL